LTTRVLLDVGLDGISNTWDIETRIRRDVHD
jgi:hypothetical protein